ncbi:MAG: MBOAT family protein [Oscillospiraceae bacterium]|nr:MBOAT family protein [Oscillospiraceae bacterium]
MVFSELTFLYGFLPIVMLMYFMMPSKGKNILLLFSSLFFYAWGEPLFVMLMLLSAAIDFTAGRLMARFEGDDKKRKLLLLVSIAINLSLLGVFKYGSFIITNVNALFGLQIPDPKLPLPIGISFYTFQSMSYTIDLYRRNIKVQKKFTSFATYVTMFPQVVAGPIVLYEDIQNEIDHRLVSVNKVSSGIGKFLKGLAKKVLIANNIGLAWSEIKLMDYGEIPAAVAWLGILAFTFQIYFDFSGYSDMAVGLGEMLGFNFPKNFDYPYMSKSISEFWRRWHITLGSWFKNYVYIPLGGNRKGLPRTILNLLLVWGLTGLWHGASWNFILWGLYFGVLIIIERLGWGNILAKLPSLASRAYTFILVVFGWVLFDTENLRDAGGYLGAMLGLNGVALDSAARYLISTNAVIFILAAFASLDIFGRLIKAVEGRCGGLIKLVSPAVYITILLLCTAQLVDATYNPFLYFRF